MAKLSGSCLCGAVGFELDAPPQYMTHCHCSRCRKTHGAPFGTYAMAPVADFRISRGHGDIASYTATGSFTRPFCRHCGSVVSDGSAIDGVAGVPVGLFDDDPGVRALAHIFVASKAPWYEITDDLPRFDEYPAGVAIQTVPDPTLPPRTAGEVRGSCLCGTVRFVATGAPKWFRFCHCGRCRKARAAAHASNLVMPADGVRFLAGETALVSYKLPDARFFTQVFCGTCGSPMPFIDRNRDLGVVPAGSLDDDPGSRPTEQIFVGSKAPWYEITDALPQFAEFPPPAK